MVNSTAVGGGVAEMLTRLLPLMRRVGLDAHWDVMEGGDDFFEVTKGFHNALHGAPWQPTDAILKFSGRTTGATARGCRSMREFIVIHDPQPVALIEARTGPQAHWVWRCHIDLSRPNQAVWDFLEPCVAPLRRRDVFFARVRAATSRSRSIFFYPSIDPLSEKNRELEPEFIDGVLARFGIDRQRAILTQISRFDRLKDPARRDSRLSYRKTILRLPIGAGGRRRADDPEGAAVLAEVREAANGDPDIHMLELPAAAPLEVNALQRASTIMIQKSLREGFGLTVAEALWKKKPVVASAVGGIPPTGDSQADRTAGAFGGRHGVSDSFSAFASGNRAASWANRATSTCARIFWFWGICGDT